jgi:hypothetical protein
MSSHLINLALAFAAGSLYTICAGCFYTTVVDKPYLRKRWYSAPAPVRVFLLCAWPLAAFWMFTV